MSFSKSEIWLKSHNYRLDLLVGETKLTLSFIKLTSYCENENLFPKNLIASSLSLTDNEL